MNKQEKDKLNKKYEESKTPYDEELKFSIKRLSYLRSELKSEEIKYFELKNKIECYKNDNK